jgi:outer membrane protein assembly factor BamE (lipoprotein component of BamABCDE complex)
MMRGVTIVAVLAVLASSGCSGRSSSSSTAPPAVAAAKPIPPDSPLAKVKIGMTGEQVSSILGAPTNQMSYESGKRWIPFYYGADVRRTEWSYKGLGRVVFTGGNVFGGGGGQVERVDYDPTETGVRTN